MKPHDDGPEEREGGARAPGLASLQEDYTGRSPSGNFGLPEPAGAPAGATPAAQSLDPTHPARARAAQVAAEVAPRSLNPFRVLVTHRNFRIFWIGQTLSLIGTWMQAMALGWLALELSNNAFLVGLVSAVGSLPILVLSLYAGAVVDRVDKLRLVTGAQVLLLVEASLLWLSLIHI